MESDLMDPAGEGMSRPAPRLMSMRSKYLTTFAIYLGNICFGASNGMYGPALVDLKNKYETTMDDISVIFTIITVCYIFGCLTAGCVFNFMNRQLCVTFLLSGMAVSTCLAPHCPTVLGLSCTAGLLGFCSGAYDAAQVVWILEMWQAKAGPFVQAQGLFIALGGLIPPLLLAPFLTAKEVAEDGQVPSASVLRPNSSLYIPFTLIGGFITVVAVYQASLFAFCRYFPPPPEKGRLDAVAEIEGSVNSVEDGLPPLKRKQKSRRIKLIVLAAVFFAADSGMELCTFSFFSAFAQYGGLRLSQKGASYLVSGVVGALIVGRVIGIFAILKIRPHLIVYLNVVIIVMANGVLLLFGNTSFSMLWAGAIGLGFGFSTINPSFIAYVERHLVFTNVVGSILLVSGGSVSAIYPLIVGKYIDENALVLMYTNLFSIAWIVLVMIVLYKLTHRTGRSQ